MRRLVDDHRQSPFLRLLLRKMSAISVLTTALEAEVEQRPRRVLARRTATEVAAGHENFAAPRAGLIEHELRAGADRPRRSASRRTAPRRARRAWSSSEIAPG